MVCLKVYPLWSRVVVVEGSVTVIPVLALDLRWNRRHYYSLQTLGKTAFVVTPLVCRKATAGQIPRFRQTERFQ